MRGPGDSSEVELAYLHRGAPENQVRNRDIRNTRCQRQVRHNHVPHMPVQKSCRPALLQELCRGVFANYLRRSTSLSQTVRSQQPSTISRSAEYYSATWT